MLNGKPHPYSNILSAVWIWFEISTYFLPDDAKFVQCWKLLERAQISILLVLATSSLLNGWRFQFYASESLRNKTQCINEPTCLFFMCWYYAACKEPDFPFYTVSRQSCAFEWCTGLVLNEWQCTKAHPFCMYSIASQKSWGLTYIKASVVYCLIS